MIKTLSDIIKSNKYEFHHAAWHSGRFGNGYTVDIPSRESTQFCIRQYWILKK